MPYNRVLRNDALSGLLTDYQQKLKGKEIHDPDERLDRFRKFLRSFRHHDEAYTETDLKTGKIGWSLGVHKWLGHRDPSDGISPIDYMEQFAHPFIQDWYRYYVKAITLAFIRRTTTYLESRFTITVPMKNHKGEWLLVKVMSMPFGKTKDGQLVSMINSFSLFGTYQGEALKMQISDANQRIPDGDESYKDFRRLMAGCMDFGQHPNLTENCFKYGAIIRSLMERQQEITLGAVWEAYNRRYNKPGSEPVDVTAVNKGIRTMRNRLTELLGSDLLTAEDIAPWQQFRKDQRNHFPLIQFCVESGIVDLFKTYKEI